MIAYFKDSNLNYRLELLHHEGKIKIEYTTTVFPNNSFFKQSYQTKQIFRSTPESTKHFDLKNTENQVVKKNLLKTQKLDQTINKNELTLYSYFVSINKINIICKTFGITVRSTKILEEADLILASKLYFKQNLKLQQLARENKIPVYIVNSNTVSQITNILKYLIEQKILMG